ncbi:MAG TPA: hypothetical protein PKC43_04700 [Phycisphaerales bacterium]|nr:hypothetical protein [Phycisphaerales bacterium]HMP36727.1 hypothetical protein [Phycisphaerales bacterium]
MWRSDATTSTVLLASVAAAAATLAFGLSFIPMGRARTIARGRVADEGGADGAIPGDSGGITILVGILFSIAAILAIGFGVALAAERADTTGIAYGLLAGGLGGGTLLAVPAFLRLQTLW